MTPGCVSKRHGEPAASAKPHIDPGYAPERRSQSTATQDTWLIQSEPVDIRLLVPIQGASLPLVFYFPGLGEGADAGLAWRQSWAEAGYAVLSAQPVKYGPAVWSSNRARVGDFFEIAKEAFAAPSLNARTEIARGLIDETRRRQLSRDPALSRVDMSRIAVAGYDLGAQTVMMLAGENVRGVEPVQVPDSVKCAVTLSPYADFSGMGLQSNFASIRLPVLSVTSGQDTDAYGLVTSAAVRRAPYQYMPAGQKYLLLLAGAPHSLFAGTGTPAKPTQETVSEPGPGLPGDESSFSDSGQGERNKRRITSAQQGSSAARRATEVAQVQSVTAAFLDATLKNDPVGSEWLSRNAKRWLGESAELLSK